MRLHMCGLQLWKFLTGKLPWPPCPSAPAQHVISEYTIYVVKDKLFTDFNDRLTSYESQFRGYKMWLDEDARASSVLVASMEDCCAVDIVGFDRAHQMWTFLGDLYESSGQSTYFAVIHYE
jgi:hypothetical protein